MQRTQIYFEPDMLADLKAIARHLNISVSEYIRRVIKKEIKTQKHNSLQAFVRQMPPLESFADTDAQTYVRDIRSSSRILAR